MVAVKITPLDFVRLARSGRGRVYQAQWPVAIVAVTVAVRFQVT
jgi:hypothetical protein